MKRILNIGVNASNIDSLNRRIRVSNLISFIIIIAMVSYIPVAEYYKERILVILNSILLSLACVSLYLNYFKKYDLSFCLVCYYGLAYFGFIAMFYGIDSNMLLFLLILCLISITLINNQKALKIFLTLAVSEFVILAIYLKDKPPLAHFTEEMVKAQHIIGTINLLLFFIITLIFFSFFRRENIIFQKAILKQKEIIEEKQNEIISSINYAKRIQFSLLASNKLLSSNLPEHFVLFKPKDVVSGDFYWATPTNEGFIYATADCTGHGVPGAFMSLLNISKLSQAINENKITRPDLILNNVRAEIIQALNKEESEESKDGMDAIVCKLDIKNLKLQYAAANNSFYIVRNNQLIVCKADKMPVGKGHDDNLSFTFNEVELKKGDLIYTFTDGYADQFGGPKGKKFRYKQFEQNLVEISQLSIQQQYTILNSNFENWKGSLEQVDDVLVIGVKI